MRRKTTRYSEDDNPFQMDPKGFVLWLNTQTTPEDQPVMPARHRHNSIELNFLLNGSIRYLMAGRIVEIPPRRLVLFWGSVPHKVIDQELPLASYALHIPLAFFLDWKLPRDFVHRILHTEIAMEQDDRLDKLNQALFARWYEDLWIGQGSNQDVVALEVQALSRRLAKALEGQEVWHTGSTRPQFPGDLAHVEAISLCVAMKYDQPLTVEDVAGEVNLHPKYATQLFKRHCGVSIKQYITMNRIHHAQLLLMTTDDSILDIALKSGFSSLSRFYDSFQAYCGCSPRIYRSTMRGGEPIS